MGRSSGLYGCVQNAGPMPDVQCSIRSSFDYHLYYDWLGKMKLAQVMDQHNSGFKNITKFRAN